MDMAFAMFFPIASWVGRDDKGEKFRSGMQDASDMVTFGNFS
jgi:hypothetical protein